MESNAESDKEEEDKGESEDEDNEDTSDEEKDEDDEEETGDPTDGGDAGGDDAGVDGAGVKGDGVEGDGCEGAGDKDAGGDKDEVPGLDEAMGDAAEKVSFMLHEYYTDDSLVGTYSDGSRCASCGHCRRGVCLPASSRYQGQEDERPQATGKGSRCLYGQG